MKPRGTAGQVPRCCVGAVTALVTVVVLSGCGAAGRSAPAAVPGSQVAATAASAGAATTVASRSPSLVTEHPASTSSTASSAATDDSTLCGPWSAAGAPFALAVARGHGGIESCFRYGTSPTLWVITTDGLNGGAGFLGVDRCATNACISGLTDHSGDHWVYHTADRPGAVRLAAPPVAGDVLQVTVGGHEETFDLASGRFGILSSLGPAGIPGLPVLGTLQTVGGPPPGRATYVPGSVRFHSTSGITVTVPVGKDGKFTASVPPGTYTVTGFSPRYYNGPCGGDSVIIPDTVPVPAVHVYCQMA